MNSNDELFDDNELDVPEYSGPKPEGSGEKPGEEPSDGKRDIYAALGRARPQKITPRRPEPVEPAGAAGAGAGEPVGHREDPAFREERLSFDSEQDAVQPEIEEPVQPAQPVPAAQPAHPAPVEAPVATEPAAEGLEENTAPDPRGTLSFGLLLLRLVLGGLLVVRGVQTLFSFAGDPGIDVLQQQLNAYTASDILAVAIPAAQIVAGGLLILGLLTPFGAALAAVVAGFMAVHNLDNHQGSLWPYGLSPYVQTWGLMAVMAMALIFTGPGGISLDRGRGWNRRPLVSAWIFALVAIAGLVGLWLGVGGRNPFN
ncbi:MAG TPA: DoxX family membrane protein [Candidatus Corynebacterium gallistercoris]|uniref:DoxX family membrane protein n=1 Tax=Candidatus Corynebacterium gallistercoris TaxID=2838530 RepID=A0A9D1UQQ3_9CORY|nr:DoxX family membrane protein [Candidatus Corynebacterium gallistercoris]